MMNILQLPEGPPDYGMRLPAPFIGKNEKTFQYQDQIASLPMPELQNTLDVYLESVIPHVTEEEYKKTVEVINRFKNGVGQELQEKLCEKAKHSRNWIEDWWRDYAYLYMRGPHPPYLSMAGPGPYLFTYWPPEKGTQIHRAGVINWFTLKYWQLIRREQLKVDRGGGKTLWCMNQYRAMFNGCKIPGMQMDTIVNFFKTEAEGHCPSDLVVTYRGRIFTFDGCDSAGDIITPPEMSAQLQYIKDLCQRQPDGDGLPSITALDRPSWAELRQRLLDLHPDNKRNLDIIERCVFVTVLDDKCPNDLTELCIEGLLGDSTTRWFDKSFCSIFFDNGLVSCTCDHSPKDGMMTIRHDYFQLSCIELNQPHVWKHSPYDGIIMIMKHTFANMGIGVNQPNIWKHAPQDAMVLVVLSFWNFTSLILNDYQWTGPTTGRNLEKPRELVFHLDEPIYKGLTDARAMFETNGSNIEIVADVYDKYAKGLIRKHKLHPDTYMQMMAQLAYYRIYLKPAPTYETASTRKYYHARTETVRSCTVEAITWCKSMLDPSVSAKEKMRLLLVAFDKHNRLMADAMENKGCDRHLFGLQIMAMELGMDTPELFTDPTYTKSGGGGNYILSTSCLGYTPAFGGVTAMCENGYGFFYSLTDTTIQMFISCWLSDEDTNVHRMLTSIRDSLADMRELVTSSSDTANL